MKETITKTEQQIAELKKRWPAHSVKPGLVKELEDLEEQLMELKRQEEKLRDK